MICGENAGQHLYMDAEPGTDTAFLINAMFSAARTSGRRYRIKVCKANLQNFPLVRFRRMFFPSSSDFPDRVQLSNASPTRLPAVPSRPDRHGQVIQLRQGRQREPHFILKKKNVHAIGFLSKSSSTWQARGIPSASGRRLDTAGGTVNVENVFIKLQKNANFQTGLDPHNRRKLLPRHGGGHLHPGQGGSNTCV